MNSSIQFCCMLTLAKISLSKVIELILAVGVGHRFLTVRRHMQMPSSHSISSQTIEIYAYIFPWPQSQRDGGTNQGWEERKWPIAKAAAIARLHSS
jgi:hypothetical protein